MNGKAPSPQQWQLLHRLQLAGCPLDLARVPPPDHPVRLISRTNVRTNVFRLELGVGIVIPVRIVATSPIIIAGYRLQADWLSTPLSWVEPCTEHLGKYCLPAAEDRHLSLSKVLNRRTLYSGRLKSGDFLEGLLVGVCQQPLRSQKPQLSATLYLEDISGREYPYGVTVRNNP